MAIQVNGTEVISNSRALNNIASVDATTAASMGAAGVGGRTTLITDNAATGANGTSVIIGPFTLGDYRTQTFTFSKIRPANGSWCGRLQMRLSDASGTTITSGYPYAGRTHNNIIYETGDSRYVVWNKEPAGGGTNDHLDMRIVFTDAYESDLATQVSWFATSKENSNSCSGGGYGNGGVQTIQRNQSFILYFENSTGLMQAGSTYSSWGVN